MSHEISFNGDRAEMAYTGETPWHGLGTKVDGLQTAQEMLRHAGLLWTVSKQPMYLPSGELVPEHIALMRDDNAKVLGVASQKYVPIQNTQAGEVVDTIMTEGSAVVEVTGALGNGERCWMLARIPGDFEVTPGDEVKPYFLLAWGHDGKHGLAGKLTPVRVVCSNTLAAAGFGVRGKRWQESADIFIRHYGNPTLRIDDARKALGLMRKQVESTTAAYKAMATLALDDARAVYFEKVFPVPVAEDTESQEYREKLAKWQAHQDTILALYENGKGAESARGTLWGAYNAVTEWTDHVYPVLQSGDTSKVRQHSVLFGAYAGVKAKAFSEALTLL